MCSSTQLKSRKADLIYKFEKFECDINCAFIIPNEDAFVILSADRSVRIYIKRDSGDYWPAVYQHLPSPGVCLEYCTTSKHIFIGCDNGTITEFELKDDGNSIVHHKDYLSHVARITGMVLSIKYNWILSCGKDKLFTFYSTQAGSCISGIQLQSPCNCIKFDEEAKYVFIGDNEGKILILDIRDCSDSFSEHDGPKVIKSLNGHSNEPIRSLYWDYKSSKLVSSGDDNLVVVWDIGGHKGDKLELLGHTKPVTNVLSLEVLRGKSNESIIISSSLDGLIIFWMMSVERKQTPIWSSSNVCERCDKPFFWNWKKMLEDRVIGCRQHHCRKCGKAVCDTCSANFSRLPPMGYEVLVRMCKDCNNSINEYELVPLINVFDSKQPVLNIHLDYSRKLLVTVGKDRFIKLWDVTALLT